MITFHPEVHLTFFEKQKELLKEFDSMSQTGANPETDSFFSKVKNFVADIGK